MARYISLIILITTFSLSKSYAQDFTASCELKLDSISNTQVTSDPEVEPIFPGGEQELMAYLMRNITGIFDDACDQVIGTLYFGCIINEEGLVVYPRILSENNLNSEQIKNACKVFSNMPTWSSGKCNKKSVSVYYTFPLHINCK